METSICPSASQRHQPPTPRGVRDEASGVANTTSSSLPNILTTVSLNRLLRTGFSVGLKNRTAGEDAAPIRSSERQTFQRDQHCSRSTPPSSAARTRTRCHRHRGVDSLHPATTSSLPLSDLCCHTSPYHSLPARPENAVIKPERVPSDAHHDYASAEEFDPYYECCSNKKPGGGHEPQKIPRTMGLTKTQRIGILLAIDGGFFLVELICGYAVHSLALVADAFHMLNDVLSLCVGLWAVRRAKAGRSSMYTYGWQRAETLGALVNGVFLVALCMSIFLEAITRFVEPQEVTNPKLVLIVGCLGLASNIIGMFLFHDHGHSHGGHSHGEEIHEHEHEHSHDPVRNAEEGHGHNSEHVRWADETSRLMDNTGGSIEDALPSVRIAGYKGSVSKNASTRADNNGTATADEGSSPFKRKAVSQSDNRHRRRSSFFTSSIDDMPIHPAGRRDEIIQASQIAEDQSDAGTEDAISPSEEEPLKDHQTNGIRGGYGSVQSHDHHEYSHANHNHRQPKEKKDGGGGHGHSHGDLNMRGVFLHVLGDALGNVGVIATALIIWLCTFPQRFYFDPGVSLVITCIILYTAIPLCKAASRILLQAVPSGMNVEEIRADIESLKGIKSAHHLHVWQLSDTKLVASLHIRIGSEIKHTGTEGYMRLAREVQECLREYGIRSSTIQPEFEMDDAAGRRSDHDDSRANGPKHCPVSTCKAASLTSNGTADKVCMLDSEDAGAVTDRADEHEHDHEHNHEHNHSHDNHDHAHEHNNGKNKDTHQH